MACRFFTKTLSLLVKPEEPLPLWLESIPDREPWRRGRLAILFISLFLLLSIAWLLFLSVLLGNLSWFLLFASFGAFYFLALYFVWVGFTWARWVLAPLFGLAGFLDLVWSMREGNGLLFLISLFQLAIFFYLGIAPSVYAFARRQRERIAWRERVFVGAVLVLLVGSIGCGLYAFYRYDINLERACTSFAGETFNQVFIYQDEEFLRRNLGEAKRHLTTAQFMNMLPFTGQRPRRVGQLRGAFTTHLTGLRLMMRGIFEVPVLYTGTQPVWVNIEVSRIGDAWQIEHIGWENYPHVFTRPSSSHGFFRESPR